MAEYLTTVLVVFTTAFLILIAYLKYQYLYWKKRKVPYLKPTLPFGNLKGFPKGIGIGKISYEYYQEFQKRGCKIGGVYLGFDPALVINDPELIKKIMIADFEHFVDRGIYKTDKHPITVNIFSQSGAEWRNIRTNMSTLFTGSKMKYYIQIMEKCFQGALPIMENAAKNKEEILLLELMMSYTTDVIGTLVYGIECNSFKHPDAEFRQIGRKVFDEFNMMDKFYIFLTSYYPKISSRIGINNIQKKCTEFFIKCVHETVDYRRKNNVKRNDIMQLLIQMCEDSKITLDEIVGQTFLFFTAGFETSTKALTYGLFELSRKQHLQDRVRQEIFDVLKKYNGEITLEALGAMKLLDQVIDETTRIYPPLATLSRVCVKDYDFPEYGVKVEKGMKVLVPCLAIHRDPKYYEDPLDFNPDRFGEEEQNSRPYYGFGIGPRHCIGARFGKIQVKIGYINVLSNYKVFTNPDIKVPLPLDPDTFVIKVTHPIYFKLEKVSKE